MQLASQQNLAIILASLMVVINVIDNRNSVWSDEFQFAYTTQALPMRHASIVCFTL